jgi:hypothetical protein
MNLGDLVHHPEGTEGNLGIVIGFDEEQDPEIEWIFHAHRNLLGVNTCEYTEDLIIISGGEDGL